MAQLGDVADFINGFAFKPEDWGSEGLPIIRIQNLTGSGNSINRTTLNVPARYHVYKGDLLVSWSASLGVFQWQGSKAVVNQHIFKVVPKKERVDLDYLRHAIGASIDEMRRFTHGSTMQHINRKEFLEHTIRLPRLEEQRRIAAILDKADALRKKRRNAHSLLLQARDSFIESEVGKGGYHRTIDLGSCLSFITTGGRNWSKYYAETGDRFIRSLDVQMNCISAKDAVYVVAPNNAEALRTRAQPGDVLLTVTGSRIGRVVELPATLAGAYVSQHVAILRPRQDKLRSKFLSYFLSSTDGQRQIRKWQYGQTKPGLNFKQIEGFQIPEIPLELQETIEHALQRFEVCGEQQEASAEALESLFSSLQYHAFDSKA